MPENGPVRPNLDRLMLDSDGNFGVARPAVTALNCPTLQIGRAEPLT